MQHAICTLSMVPVRLEPSHSSEISNQLLFGEHFFILSEKSPWYRIRSAFDNTEGWIDSKQAKKISEENFRRIDSEEPVLTADLMEFIEGNDQLTVVPLGSVLNGLGMLGQDYGGLTTTGKQPKNALLETAYLYLNAPFLWGGKSPFGIDASGFTQMVYKLNGYRLARTAAEQARQGESLSFIEESEPGDLVFFDNPEGVINHVGIILGDNYIIHADGKVRLDRIDHSGIYNADLRKHTHQLRVIKKII